MARAGITKYSVEKARNILTSKGVNPSIDAIRVELGNTGSKTTISRYLKELEAEESVQLEDEALLSEGIKDIIAKLANKLHQEATEVITKSESHFQEEIKDLKTNNKMLTSQLNQRTKQLEELQSMKTQLVDSNHSLESELESQRVKLSDSSSLNNELKSVLHEKDEQIDTLKQNHQNSRESLEHYRESIKEQREQELRQHEQQVQHLQGEIRQLNQTLIVKQTDITNLNKDNSRLVTEASNLQKLNLNLERQNSQYTSELKRTKEKEFSLNNDVEIAKSKQKKLECKMKQLSKENESYKKDIDEKALMLVRLETELLIKNELLKNLNISGINEIEGKDSAG